MYLIKFGTDLETTKDKKYIMSRNHMSSVSILVFLMQILFLKKKKSSAYNISWHSVVVIQLPSHVQFFLTPWTTTHQAFLPLTTSQSLSKFMSIALVMPSRHLILSHSLLPSIFPSIRIFSNESAVRNQHCFQCWL